MPLLSLSRRHAPLDSAAALVEDFARAGGGSATSLAEYWGALKGRHPVSALAALAKREIQDRFARGERPSALEYFERFPELAERGDHVVSLVYEEFCLLEEGGESPSVGQFCRRYQSWSDSIASQLGYHRELSRVAGAAPGRDRYPQVGDRFATYTLQEILGRGGAAKVFRAVDDLGDRQVVLKISRTMGLEPSILAALNHDNIVKILTQVNSPELGMSGICMPYHPGVTLDAILDALANQPGAPRRPRRARALWEALGLDGLDRIAVDKFWAGFPIRGTYTEAVAWVGLVLADALQYAHDRGVFHRDIKPANILIARREGPLLFDFNLAHRHSGAERAQDAMSGGTLPYMAPEQLRAFVDPALWDAVRAGADIYALGLVLRELATGQKPPLPPPGLSLARSIQALLDGRPELARSIRQDHPDVPPALDAIIGKCLAPQVEDRYADAGQLSEDLRRFLDRRPLLHAGNPSRLELALNWTYRHRKPALGVAASILLGWLAVRAIRPAPSPAAPSAFPSVAASPEGPGNPPGPIPPPERPVAPFYPGEAVELFRIRATLAGDNLDPLLKAANVFDQLARKHPGSAWPLVYEAFALDRLKYPERTRTNHSLTGKPYDLIKESLNKGDCVAALESWRTEPATQAFVLYMIGNYHAKKKNFEEARRYYDEAIAANEADASPYCGQGDIACQVFRFADAIAWYNKGLARLTVPNVPDGSKNIHQLGRRLIPLEHKELDQVLAVQSSKIDWDDVRARLDVVGNHLYLFDRSHKQAEVKETGDLDASTHACMRGDLASAWGYYFAQVPKEEGLALATFAEALQNYREAELICKNLLARLARDQQDAARTGKKSLAEASPVDEEPERIGKKSLAESAKVDQSIQHIRDQMQVLNLRIQDCGLANQLRDVWPAQLAESGQVGSPEDRGSSHE